MFSSSIATKELPVCLRCEFYLLRRSFRTQTVLPASRARNFAASSRLNVSRESIDNVRATSDTINTNAEHDRRRSPKRFPLHPAKEDKDPTLSLLRLAAPAAASEQRADKRDHVYVQNDRSAYTASSEHKLSEKYDITEFSVHGPGQSGALEREKELFRYPAFRHPDVASDRVELGLERLGEPATIRVLPERRDRVRQSKKPRTEDVSQVQPRREKKQRSKSTFDDVVKGLDLENQGAAGAAEAMNNIETLRRAFLDSMNPLDGASQAECSRLAGSLSKGFTTDQLRGYKMLAITMKPNESDKLDKLIISERYRTSRWFAGSSKWPEKAPRRLDLQDGSHKKNPLANKSEDKEQPNAPKQETKHKLIGDIIRECWGIRSKEERLQEGPVDISIDKEWLELLLRQVEEQVFYKVSQNFKVKTEVSEELGLVRVTGDYDACTDAVRKIVSSVAGGQVQRIELYEAASNKAASTIQHRFIADVVKHRQFWADVEDQTFTKIQPVNTDGNRPLKAIDVYCLPEITGGIAGVTRRVRQLQKLLRQDPAGWASHPTLKRIKPTLLPVARNPDMSFTERCLNWYRLQDLRPTQERDGEISTVAGGSDAVFGELIESWTIPCTGQMHRLDHGALDSHWKPRPQTSMTATFCQIVYAIPDDGTKSLQKPWIRHKSRKDEPVASSPFQTNSFEQILEQRRTTSHSIPNLASLLNSSLHDEATLSSFFKIKLTPKAVGKESMDMQHAPQLELDVDIDESDKTTKLRNASLVAARHRFDLALPHQLSDVQFTAETRTVGSSKNPDPLILEFIQQSNLNVLGTGQFQTPSTLTLTIPQEACKLVESISLARTKLNRTSVREHKISTSDKDQAVVAALPEKDLRSAYSGWADCQESENAPGTLITSLDKLPEQESRGVQVEYVFDSLSVHSKLQCLYRGFPISFSTIEGGQVGGRREEVKLEAPGMGDDLINGGNTDGTKEHQEQKRRINIARSYFMSYFECISDLIGRLR